MLVFDIGANRGAYSAELLAEHADARIVAIEANANLIAALRSRFEARNVEILNLLLAEKSDQQIPFFVANVDTISTASTDWVNDSRFTGDFKWRESKAVQSINLDSLISLYGVPDSIKIDIEGYEYEAIKGLTQRVPELGFEWAEESYDLLNKAAQHLESIGFSEFGYTFEDKYGTRPRYYDKWSNLDIHQIIKPIRKELWGMIWVR